jgi:transcriptional regulator with XRE-family HTH domain
VRHLKEQMRLTSREMAVLAGVSTRTIQDIKQGRSDGTVQTMNRIFGVVGLKLAVVRAPEPRGGAGAAERTGTPGQGPSGSARAIASYTRSRDRRLSPILAAREHGAFPSIAGPTT